MSRFKAIDKKLYQFAERYKAEIATKGSTLLLGDQPVWINSQFAERIGINELTPKEERRISWIDGPIAKGVYITPHYLTSGESNLWDFENIAILKDGNPRNGVLSWSKNLLEAVEFHEIEKNIDRLLLMSAENLDAINLKDLKL